MKDTCRAIVFNGDGTYEIRKFDIPEPTERGAVIKVEAVGMCSSDAEQFMGHHHVPGEVAPVVPGHEIVGRVYKLADDADLGVSVGDRVAVDLINRTEVYNDRLVIYGYTLGVNDLGGLWGGYGEYMSIMGGTNLLKLTEKKPPEYLTNFEPLANAVNWVKQAGVKKGDTVVILGPGHIGLMCIAAAKEAGASNIIVTGKSVDSVRLKAAIKAGADHTIDVDKEDAVAKVSEITNGRKADIVMDVTAMSTAAVRQAFDMITFSGTILLAGLKNKVPVELVTDNIVLNCITVKGGAGSTEESMRTAVNLLNEGKIPGDELVGEVLTIDDFEEAMQLLKREHPEREAVRVTIVHK